MTTIKNTNAKRQLTRAEVIEQGKYLGFVNCPSGGTWQYWEANGIVFCQVANENGFNCGWHCSGRLSKFLREHPSFTM